MNTLIFSLALYGALLTLPVTSNLFADDTSSKTTQEEQSYRSFSNPFIQAVKKTSPAVVSIKSQILKSDREDQGDPFADDFWNYFFGTPQNQGGQKLPSRPEYALGSGFLVSDDGYILTNNHMIEDATKISVQLTDGREFPAKKIGSDPSTDIALIKIESSTLPFIHLADSSTVETGEWVIAIGNPLGLQTTVTTGVISAKGRSDLDIMPVEEFFQTDAPINRGNSGGPLVNLNGDVIGMNTAIISNTGGYMGISFAISSNLLKEVMSELITHGKLDRGFLGVALQAINNDLALALGMEKPKGALVSDVLPTGPADKAGLKSGDVITKVNGIEIETAGNLKKSISLMRPGKKVDLTILRSGKLSEVTATIDSFPNDEKKAIEASSTFGMTLEPITAEAASRFSLSTTTGLLVVQVDPNGSAYTAGIRPGHVIIAVNGTPVSTLAEFTHIYSSLEKGKKVLLQVRIGTHNHYVSLPNE